MSDMIDASLSLIEQEKDMSDTFQTGLGGHISRGSELFESLEARAQEILGDTSDSSIRFVLNGLFLSYPFTRTVSVTEKGFPQQYHSIDYFDSRTIDFTTAAQRLRDLSLAEADGEDLTETLTNHFKRFRAFMDSVMEKEEAEARRVVTQRMELDGLRSKAQDSNRGLDE